MSLDTLIIVLSLIFSAFFSGMEIAFVSSNKIHIEIEKKQRGFLSLLLTKITAKPSKFIATMLIGNNIALVVYGIVMTQILTPQFSDYFNSALILLLAQTFITTMIVLITAEFLPKAIFRIFPNHILKVFSLPIWLFFVMFRPLALLMLNLANLILKYVLNQKISILFLLATPADNIRAKRVLVKIFQSHRV